VLSEGELRCLAIAAFLAELETAEGTSGIVLDDPISSLDHVHREKIAARLAKEALSRQVLLSGVPEREFGR
jgi:wobble nucleotide-excising tRNase